MTVTLSDNADIWEITNKLAPMIWERIIAVYNNRGFTLPKVVAGKTFGWKYTSINIPSDSYMALLLGTTRPVGARDNIGIRFWTRTYPYEIHALSDFPLMPESIRPDPLYARFTSNSGTLETEKENDLKIFQRVGDHWVFVDKDVTGRPIEPTIIEELGPPKPGDYVLHLWRRWIGIINSTTKRYIKLPTDFNKEFESLNTKIKRYFPQEINGIYPNSDYNDFPVGSYYQDAADFGKLYQKTANGNISANQGPSIRSQTYPNSFIEREISPQLGDYFMFAEVLENLKQMKYTPEQPESVGSVKVIRYEKDFVGGHIIIEDKAFPYNTVEGPQPTQVIENGKPAGGFIQAFISTGGPIGSGADTWTHLYGDGKWFLDRPEFVPTEHTNHVMLKFVSNFGASHSVLGSGGYSEMNNVDLSGFAFSPQPEEDDWDNKINNVEGKGYTEWKFEYD